MVYCGESQHFFVLSLSFHHVVFYVVGGQFPTSTFSSEFLLGFSSKIFTTFFHLWIGTDPFRPFPISDKEPILSPWLPSQNAMVLSNLPETEHRCPPSRHISVNTGVTGDNFATYNHVFLEFVCLTTLQFWILNRMVHSVLKGNFGCMLIDKNVLTQMKTSRFLLTTGHVIYVHIIYSMCQNWWIIIKMGSFIMWLIDTTKMHIFHTFLRYFPSF